MHIYFLFLNVIFFTLNYSLAHIEPPNSILVNCGTSGNSKGKHGRQWDGDIGSVHLVSSIGSKARFIKSAAISSDSLPYTSARISHQQFTYAFEVSSGQKFIRLYFYPTAYSGFRRSNGFFTVKAGPYTLLSNFSASLTADALGVKYFMKEFCVNVERNQPLLIMFSPSFSGNSKELYSFVNGIEITSMPHGLYYTPVGELGTNVVGQNYRMSLDRSIALEMVHRLNVGGTFISSDEDIGLYREWFDDSNFLVSRDLQPVSTTMRIKYGEIPTYTTPQRIYQTSWAMATVVDKRDGSDYNFTWKLPADLGFNYLIRFHFCELRYEIEDSSNSRFDIVINDQMAEANANLIKWSGGNGIAISKDYIVTVKGDRTQGKRDLLIMFCLKSSNTFERRDETVDAILKGLEIFKLSNNDNNLAGMNPVFTKQNLNSSTPTPRKSTFARWGNTIATFIVILVSLLNIVIYQLRVLCESSVDKRVPLSPSELLSRRLSLAEIRSATNNFDDLLVIGSGGFGLVYKGIIDEITVAIKRLNSMSKQGADEFWTEIEMLSELRHTHLVSLIGYCDEGREMILVYDYMEHGTLADHLYKNNSNDETNPQLSWEQKLHICIGAARGLDYLHTGTRHGVIHRDVKSTNILLDNEWVAKISDFGLCKIGTTNHSRTHVSTNVKGTFGYLDPDYFLTHRLTKKSDVYAFGVVLLEILCGRPSVDISLAEERRSLALWAQQCIKEGKTDEIINPNLRDQISSHCLRVFTEVAYKCLHNRPNGRPTMADVVVSLEGALMSDNPNEELSPKQNEVDGDDDDDSISESDEEHIDGELELDNALLQGAIPSPTTPLRDSDNIEPSKKSSTGKLGEAYNWSIGMFTKSMDVLWKKKKDYDFPSGESDSTNEKLQSNNTYLPSRRFKIVALQAATDDFNRNLKIAEGDFGMIFKGWINCGTLAVAIKCTKPLDADEQNMYKAKIKAQSQFSHPHLITLIGYCDDEARMLLVYEYMVNRSLYDHLYGGGSGHSPLLWTKRLEICIGVAKGLEYLHSGTKERIIHRNIKPSKILLDENLVAKISDFDLAKVVPTDFTDVTTFFCGTVGYADPDCIQYFLLSEKSDVYAFGVVLLEVLCARKPFDHSLNEDQMPLVQWFRTCLRKRKIDQMIDPYLIGKISPECLMQYLKIVWECLLDRGTQRPVMNSVVERLQFALQLQQDWCLGAEIDALPE